VVSVSQASAPSSGGQGHAGGGVPGFRFHDDVVFGKVVQDLVERGRLLRVGDDPGALAAAEIMHPVDGALEQRATAAQG